MSAARRTCLLGLDCGEQLLHGARRRCAERLIKVDRLRKLLADEFITPREFAVARERLLNAISFSASERAFKASIPEAVSSRMAGAPAQEEIDEPTGKF